jgi:hypothetical protein
VDRIREWLDGLMSLFFGVIVPLSFVAGAFFVLDLVTSRDEDPVPGAGGHGVVAPSSAPRPGQFQFDPSCMRGNDIEDLYDCEFSRYQDEYADWQLQQSRDEHDDRDATGYENSYEHEYDYEQEHEYEYEGDYENDPFADEPDMF